MRYLFLLMSLAGCTTKQQLRTLPSGDGMSLDEAAKPVSVELGAGDVLGYQTLQEMSIFAPENILIYATMIAISGFLMWREFVSKKR